MGIEGLLQAGQVEQLLVLCLLERAGGDLRSAISASFSSRSRSFSSASEGRCASPEKKSPIGSVTVVTARCIGAMNALAASPATARGPESRWR